MKEKILVEVDLTDVGIGEQNTLTEKLKAMELSPCPTSKPPRNPDAVLRLNPLSNEGFFTFEGVSDTNLGDDKGEEIWHKVHAILGGLGVSTSIYVETETML